MSAIDMSRLPAPSVIEVLDYEAIYAERKAALIALFPEEQQADIAATLTLESEPLAILLQENAYREMLLRQRVNDACRAVMLAYAIGADLDQLGANVDVPRLTIIQADATTTPPTLAEMESDSDYRARIQLSFQGYSTAGSRGSYIFHAMSADGKVKDALPVSPTPGKIMVYVMSRLGDGTADAELLAKVRAAVNADIVRPMSDQVDVQSASILTYALDAELVIYDGPDADTVEAAARRDAQAYADSVHRIGYDVALSGFFKALHQPGVKTVNLTAPAGNIVIAEGQAAYCTGITLTVRKASHG